MRCTPPDIVSLEYVEYGVNGDLTIRYPKPDSIYLKGTICGKGFKHCAGTQGHRHSFGGPCGRDVVTWNTQAK